MLCLSDSIRDDDPDLQHHLAAVWQSQPLMALVVAAWALALRISVQIIESVLAESDLIIGAVLVPGAKAPNLVKREQLKLMKKGAVIVDVAVDQGGCVETTRPTTHDDPVFVLDDVVHYCVANMPGSVPVTSSAALNNATLPFGLLLADRGLVALSDNPHLAAGLNVHEGAITHPSVAKSLGLPYRSLFQTAAA